MKKHNFYLVPLFFLTCLSQGMATNYPVKAQLDNPTFKDGKLSTQEGGIVEGPGFKLQAKTIVYTKSFENDAPVHRIYAKGDLMLDYYGQIFIGDEINYDFNTKEGVLKSGKTHINIWYLEGKEVHFHKDESFEVFKARITTSDISTSEWEMTANKIHLTKDKYLSTKDIKVKVFKLPIFWIPGFRSDLKALSDNPVRYGVKWITGQGPQFGMRYKIYSNENFETFLRIAYLYARGPSAAFEANFHSSDKRTQFKSQNYYAHDTFYRDNDPNKRRKRFRLQGVFTSHSKNEKAEVLAMYDKISDKNLPSDFKSEDFELNTARKTQLRARYFHDQYIAGLNIEPRINNFEGFKQELPKIDLSVKPIKFRSLPLVMDNRFNFAFYDYVYTNLLGQAPLNFQTALSNFHALRASTCQNLYLPLNAKGFSFTPYGGFIGVVYSDNPKGHSAYQSVFNYGLKTSVKFERKFTRFSHKVEPYVNFDGYSKPSLDSSDVYIFGINDGFHRLNMARVGLFQSFVIQKFKNFSPNFTFDAYTLGFFGDKTYQKTFPKAGFESIFQTDSVSFKTLFQWNFNNHLLDVCNSILGITINPNVALQMEFRHRSRFYFRKDNYDNYIVEAARSLENLVDSPMSDGRNTFLSRLEIKLLPTCTLQLQTQSGWGRRNQKNYNEAKIDLYTMLTTSWRLRLSYAHTTRADIFTCGINLIRK